MSVSRDDNLRAVGATCADPQRVCRTDHYNLRRRAVDMGRECDGDRVIAGADRGYTGCSLSPGKTRQVGQRGTCLEGAGSLQEFQLGKDLGLATDRGLDRRAPDDGRSPYVIAKPLAQCSYFGYVWPGSCHLLMSNHRRCGRRKLPLRETFMETS